MCWYRRKSPAAEEKHSLSRRAPRATLSFSRSFRARAEVLWNCALATNRCRQICKTGRDFEVGVRWAFIIYSTFLFTISCFKTCRFRTLRWYIRKLNSCFCVFPGPASKGKRLLAEQGSSSTGRRRGEKKTCAMQEKNFSLFSLCSTRYVPSALMYRHAVKVEKLFFNELQEAKKIRRHLPTDSVVCRKNCMIIYIIHETHGWLHFLAERLWNHMFWLFTFCRAIWR